MRPSRPDRVLAALEPATPIVSVVMPTTNDAASDPSRAPRMSCARRIRALRWQLLGRDHFDAVDYGYGDEPDESDGFWFDYIANTPVARCADAALELAPHAPGAPQRWR